MTLATLDSSARQLFDTLSASAGRLSPPRHDPDAGTEAGLAERIEAHWAAARVVSFDVFDTALVRKVRTPKDVFLFLYALPPIQALELDSQRVARLREQAENVARQRAHAARGTAEVSLADVYRVFLELVGAPGADDVIPALVEAEESAELAVAAAHPYFLELYRRAHRDGKQVWFVSDIYHGAEFLRRLLQHAGYDDPADLVTTSCDEGVSKGGEGRLFSRLLAARGVDAASVLHVGDHPTSDGTVPLALGIRAVHHPLAATVDPHTITGSAEEALVAGLTGIEERCHLEQRSFWWRFGYATAGPALAGFALWLHGELRRDGVRHAYFLLRDGEILRRVYDVFAEGRADAVPSSLLHSSRRAFMMPALVTGRRSITEQLFVSASPRPVSEFLTRLGVPVDGLGAAFLAAGFADGREVIDLQDGGDAALRLGKLYTHPEVGRRLGARSQAERDLLLAYLRQERVIGHGRAAVIDVGWNGTIQKCLEFAAAHERVPTDVIGYYFGTAPNCGARDAEGLRFKSYFFHNGEPRAHYAAVFSFVELMELICSSAQGSLRRFERAGGRVRPVCEEPEVPEEQLRAVRELHEGALAFAATLRAEMATFDFGTLPAEVAGAALVRVIAEPTPVEAATIGAMQHGDGMGSATAKHLARFSSSAIDPQRIVADYGRAYWKRGLLAQRTPQAMVLRNLLWLAGTA